MASTITTYRKVGDFLYCVLWRYCNNNQTGNVSVLWAEARRKMNASRLEAISWLLTRAGLPSMYNSAVDPSWGITQLRQSSSFSPSVH